MSYFIALIHIGTSLPFRRVTAFLHELIISSLFDCEDIKTTVCGGICKHLLFVHALLGCHMTFRLFNIGIESALIKKSTKFAVKAEVFHAQSTSEEIINSRENAATRLYGRKVSICINDMRYDIFKKKVSSESKTVETKCLPPTSAALAFHSLL